MSHVGNGEHDFEDLNHFSEEDRKHIKNVRILARKIIDMLEPRHINTHARLLYILEEAMQRVKSDSSLHNPKGFPLISDESAAKLTTLFRKGRGLLRK